jgi:hypothetical protein
LLFLKEFLGEKQARSGQEAGENFHFACHQGNEDKPLV